MAESEKKSYNIKSNARYIVDLLTLTGKLPVSERETIPEINNNAQLLAWASTKKYFEIWRNPRYVRPGDILLFGANTTGISFKFSDGLIFESVEGEIVKERHIRNVSHLLRLVDVIVEEEIFPTPIEFLPEIIPTPQDAPPSEQEQISAPVEWCRRILANVSVHFSGRWNGDPEIDQHYLWDEQFDSRMIGGIYGGIKEVHRCEQFLVFNAVLPNRLVEYVQGLEVAKHSLVINIIAKVENGSSFLSVNFGSTIGAPIPQIVEDELLQDDINSTVVVEVSEIDPVVNELPKAECHVEIDEYGKIINNLFPTTLNRVFTDPGTDSTWSLEIEIDDEEGITFLCESDCDGWIPPDYGPYTECDCAPTININVPISGQEILISYIKQLIRNTNESIGTKCNPQHILEFVLSIEGIKYDDSEKIFLVPGQYYTYIVNTGEINGICLGRIYVDPIPPDPDPDPEVQDCTCPTIDLCIDPAGQKYEWDELKTILIGSINQTGCQIETIDDFDIEIFHEDDGENFWWGKNFFDGYYFPFPLDPAESIGYSYRIIVKEEVRCVGTIIATNCYPEKLRERICCGEPFIPCFEVEDPRLVDGIFSIGQDTLAALVIQGYNDIQNKTGCVELHNGKPAGLYTIGPDELGPEREEYLEARPRNFLVDLWNGSWVKSANLDVGPAGTDYLYRVEVREDRERYDEYVLLGEEPLPLIRTCYSYLRLKQCSVDPDPDPDPEDSPQEDPDPEDSPQEDPDPEDSPQEDPDPDCENVTCPDLLHLDIVWPPEYEPNFDLLTSGYEHALRTMDKYRIYDEALWDPPACKPLIIENQFFLALQYGKAHEAAYLLDVQPCDYTFTVLPPEFCTCRDAGDFELFWGPAPDYVEDIHAWFRQNPWDVDEDFIISQVRVWCPHGGRENFRAYVDTDKSSPMTIDKYNVVYTYRVVVGPAWTTTSSMAGPTSFGGSYHHCEVKIIARPFNGEPPGECCPLEISSEWNYGPVFRTADPYTGTYDFTWPTEADAAAAGIGGLNTDPECKYCASEINGNRAGKTETLSPGAYQIAFIVYPCKDKSWEQSECPVGIWMIVVIEDPDPDDCCPIGIEDVTTYYTSDDTSDPNGYGEDDRVYHTFMTNAAVAANAIHIGVPFNPNCEYIAIPEYEGENVRPGETIGFPRCYEGGPGKYELFITWNIYPIKTLLNPTKDGLKPGIEPDCTTTFTERAILMCRSCCPIEVEPDDHPKGYDYGKGYTFTWPPQPLLGFAVPEDAEHCTYTTTFDLDDPTVTYFVPKDRDFIEVFGTYTIVNDQGTPCPETVTDSLIIEKVEDSPPINCCPIECEPGGLTMTDYGDGVVYAFPADPGLWGPTGDEADERCTYNVVIDDPEKLKPTRYRCPGGAKWFEVRATYTITAREDPECSITCDHTLTIMCDEMKEYNRCCPIESESGSHPVGYDYGNGYKFAFPWLNIFGFVPPEDAKFKEQEVYVHEDGYDKFRTRAGDCTYTTTISDADATDLQVYGVPDYKDFIEIVVGYTISNDQGEDCSIYVEDSLTVIKVEDSPPINCCPIECEPSYHYGTDYNGEGFLYSFPADPGLWGPTGDEADERCTYTVVIDDPGKLKPTRYYGPSTVTATYTITSAEDDCDVTCDHSLVVELIESECCPIEVEPDDHPKGYDYGKGYTFTWPPQPLLGFAVPEDAGDCTYTTTFDLDDPTVTYFVPDNKDSIEVFGTYTIVNDQGPPCPETVSDSLTVIKVEDSPEIDCCPIESEPSYDYGTDYNGEGFLYSFPADPGLWTPGDEADERCTYTVVIDDPEKLKPTRYYGPSTVTATYTITAREDPECSVTCDHSLVVELIEDECCPVTATDVTTYYSPEDTSGGDDRVYHTFMTNAQAAAQASHSGITFNPDCEYIAIPEYEGEDVRPGKTIGFPRCYPGGPGKHELFITWNIYPISTRLNVAGDAPEPGIKPNCQTTFTERAILSCGCCPIDMSGFYKKSDGSFGVDVFYTKEQLAAAGGTIKHTFTSSQNIDAKIIYIIECDDYQIVPDDEELAGQEVEMVAGDKYTLGFTIWPGDSTVTQEEAGCSATFTETVEVESDCCPISTENGSHPDGYDRGKGYTWSWPATNLLPATGPGVNCTYTSVLADPDDAASQTYNVADGESITITANYTIVNEQGDSCPETVTDSLTITGSYDSPEIDCCPVEAENTNIKVKDDGSGYSYAFPAEAPGGPKAPEGEPGVDDPLNPDCTWIHKISDSSLLETKTYIVPEGADALAVAATYTITSREDPDCSVTCKHQLTVTADEPGNCCPISTEDGTLPTAYDYGKGYTVSWPAKNSLGFAPPSDADSDCTYTTKLTSSDAPGKYYVPNGSFITLTATYTITNDGDPKCSKTVTDSLTIKGKYKEIDCCPVEAEDTTVTGKDSGDGFSYSFPAEAPGGPKAPEGEPGVYDPVLNPDCTWIHKISDSSLLEEKTYTVAKGATEMAVAATYTITAAEDPDCSVTCKHQLKVFADKPNCCPMKTNPGQHPPACDYGKGYWFTWPATSINPATAGTPNAGEPPVAENCTYTTVLDPDTVEEPTQLYFTAVDGGGNDFTATRAYIATNDQGEPCGARRFHDSIKIKDCSEDSPELGECCPIDAELGSQGTKGSDKNGEGFEFAFPADPGGWAQGDGTDERCTYDVVIDDPEKLKPTKYYVPEGLDKYDVVATYTITAREDYKCTQSTDYTLTVERDKIYCCPIDPDHMGGIHTGYDYGKGYKFTWPATSINPAKAGEAAEGQPQPDPTCTYKTALVNGSNTTTTIYLSEANPYSRTTRSYVATATNKNASSNCAYTFSDYLDVHWAGDDSPELGDCCPIDAEPFVKEVTDNGEGFTYAFPADPGGWAQGAETDERCTYNVVIDDKSLLNETTYFVPPGEDSITITANYTITSKEEPDCSANLSYGLKVSRGVCRANCKDEDVEFTQEEFDAEGGAPLTPAMAIAASSLTGDEDLCTGFTPTADPNTDQYVTAPGQSKTFQITYSNGGGDNYVCNVKLTAKLKLTECCPLKVSDSLGPKVKAYSTNEATGGTVDHTFPTIASVTAAASHSGDPQNPKCTFNVSSTSTDPGPGDTHTLQYGESASVSYFIQESNGSCEHTETFSASLAGLCCPFSKVLGSPKTKVNLTIPDGQDYVYHAWPTAAAVAAAYRHTPGEDGVVSSSPSPCSYKAETDDADEGTSVQLKVGTYTMSFNVWPSSYGSQGEASSVDAECVQTFTQTVNVNFTPDCSLICAEDPLVLEATKEQLAATGGFVVKKSQISALGILQSNIEDGCDDYKLGAAASVSFTAEGTKPGLVQMTDATGKVIDDCQIYIEVKEKKEKSCDLICPDAVIVVVVPEDDLPYDYTEVMKKAAVKVTPACEDEELYPNGYVVHLSQPGDTEFTKYETKSFGAKLWRSANGDVGGGQPDDTCTWQVRVQREKSEPCVIECFDGAKHIVPAGTGTDSVTVPKSVALANVSVSDGGKNAFDCGEDDCKTDATPAERTGKVGDTVTFTVTMTCTYIDAVTLKKVTDTDSCDVSIEIEEAECDLTCTDLVKYTGTFPFNITKAMVEGQVEYDSDCNAGEEITLEIVGDFPEEVEDPGGLYTYPVRLVDKDNTILDTCNVKVDVKPTCGLVCQDPAEYGSTTFLPDYFEQGNKYTVKASNVLNSIPKNESCPENYTTVIEPTEDYEFTTFGTIYWGVTLKNGDGDVVDSCSVKTDVTEDGSAEP